MTRLVNILDGRRFEFNSKSAFTHLIKDGMHNDATSIQISQHPVEIISRKGLLIPLHISIYQAFKIFWLEMVMIGTAFTRYSNRVSTLHKYLVDSTFRVDAYKISRRMMRRSKSTQPERINKNYLNCYVNFATIHWLGIYEELHISIEGGRNLEIIQPCVVLCHTYDTNWRDVFPTKSILGSEKELVSLNPDNVKCYVAKEFDAVYTWDKPMRGYFRQNVIPLMKELNIEIVHVPMVELRNSIMHSPDFSKINPFEGTNKIKMDVKTSRNYYSSV